MARERNLCSCQGPITNAPEGWTHDNDADGGHTPEPTLDPTIAYGIQIGDAIVLVGITAFTAAEALALTRGQYVPPHTDADITLVAMCVDHPDERAPGCAIHQAACAATGHGDLIPVTTEDEPVQRSICGTCGTSITTPPPEED